MSSLATSVLNSYVSVLLANTVGQVLTREKRNACAHGLLLKIHGFYAKFRAYYRTVPPKPFISGAIENKVKKGAL